MRIISLFQLNSERKSDHTYENSIGLTYVLKFYIYILQSNCMFSHTILSHLLPETFRHGELP